MDLSIACSETPLDLAISEVLAPSAISFMISICKVERADNGLFLNHGNPRRINGFIMAAEICPAITEVEFISNLLR